MDRLVMHSLLTCLRWWRRRWKQIIPVCFSIFLLFCQCFCNHGEAPGVGGSCQSGTTAVIIFLQRWQRAEDLHELPSRMNREPRKHRHQCWSLCWAQSSLAETLVLSCTPCLLIPLSLHLCQMTGIGVIVIQLTWIIYITPLNSWQMKGAKEGNQETE